MSADRVAPPPESALRPETTSEMPREDLGVDLDDLLGVRAVIDEWCFETGQFEDGEQSYSEIVQWMIRRLASLEARS